jgi:hypothetical protein
MSHIISRCLITGIKLLSFVTLHPHTTRKLLKRLSFAVCSQLCHGIKRIKIIYYNLRIATEYGLYIRGARNSSQWMVKNVLFPTASGLAQELTQPPVKLTQGALSPGVKQTGDEPTTLSQRPLRSRKLGYMLVHPFRHESS